MPGKVFLSHAWADKSAHGRRLKLLELELDHNFELWVDKHQLEYGASISKAVRRGIANSDVVVLAWSKNAAQSDGVRQEIEVMRQLKKRVLIAALDGHSFRKSGLGEHPLVFQLYESEDFEFNLQRLITEICTHLVNTNSAYAPLKQEQQSINSLARELQDLFNRRGSRNRRPEDGAPFITGAARHFAEMAKHVENGPCRNAYIKLAHQLKDRDDLARLSGQKAFQAFCHELELADPACACANLQQWRQVLGLSVVAEKNSSRQNKREARVSKAAADPVLAVAARTRRILETADSRELLRVRVQEVLALQGRAFPQAINTAVEQFVWLVSSMPDLLAGLRDAALAAGVAPQLAPIIDAACEYVLEEDDVVPDTAGVLGLLDDTFVILACLHLVNQRAMRYAGQPLLAFNPSVWSAELTLVLTPPVVQHLLRIGESIVMKVLGPDVAYAPTEPIGHGPGSWGGSFEDEMARRAALMGISLP